MDDHGLAAAITAGDPDGLTEAMDRYGPSLLAYCRSAFAASVDGLAAVGFGRTDAQADADDGADQDTEAGQPDSFSRAAAPSQPAGLGEATAEEAVIDTFVIAWSRVDGLTVPGKLAAWLHAVARGECARRAAEAGVIFTAPDEADPAEAPPVFPQRLRGKILAICTDETPTGRAERASVVHRAGPFGHDGFPRPARIPGQRGPGLRRRAGVIATSAGLAAIAAIAVAVIALTGSHPGKAAAATQDNGTRLNPGQGLPGSSSSGTGVPGKATPTAAQHVAGTPSPGATASLQAAHTPAPSPSPQPASSPASGSPSPSASPSPTPPQAGTLVPSTLWLAVTSINNRNVSISFMLTAQGGPVTSYTISTRAPGRVSIMPQSGSIPAGGSVLITVTVHTKTTFTTPLTLSPNGGVVWLHVVARITG